MANSSINKTLYDNAVLSLFAGSPGPNDCEILSYSPLPADVIDPYASQEVDPVQVMELAYNAMRVWIEEAAKANYFSKRFVQLSKLVLNGVTTMGRGLVSLHNRGADLSEAPMSISDLIGVASYHFRKSYLGVLQTARSYPQISERLLVNQLSWSNMLMRLYKTKEKLEQSIPSLSENQTGTPAASLQAPVSEALLPTAKKQAAADIAAFFEPGAFTQPRALSSLDGNTPALSRHSAPGHKPAAGSTGSKTIEKSPEKADGLETTEPGGAGSSTETAANERTEPDYEREIRKQAENNRDEQTKAGKKEQAAPAGPRQDHISQPLPDHQTEPRGFYTILKAAYERSLDSEDNSVSFTIDEMDRLVSDPDFCEFDPVMTDDMRHILEKIRSTSPP